MVATTYDARMIPPVSSSEWLTLTTDPLDVAAASEWAGGPEWGAIVGFSGVVRSYAESRSGVTAIEYEAYAEHVVPGFERLAATARERWSDLGRIVVWHRTGLVPVGEASVVIVVSSPHRAEAFEACRYLIDSVKQTAPIWKREFWPGGSDWSPASSPIVPVDAPAVDGTS